MSYDSPPPWAFWYFGRGIQDFIWRANLAGANSPFEVTSWWRSEDSNRQAGGESYSQHLVGFAADLVPKVGSLQQLAGDLGQVGLIPVLYPGHVHVQLLPAGVLEAWLRG